MSDHTLELDISKESCDYLTDLDRSGLKWPFDYLVKAITHMFLIFPLIIGEEYESKFLSVGRHKALLSSFIECLNSCGLMFENCVCGNACSDLLKSLMPIVANL